MNVKSALLTLAMLALLSAPVLAQEAEEEEGLSAADAFALKVAISLFQNADLDKDGKLSRDEFSNYKKFKGKMFETYDTNGDSIITLDEWKTGHTPK